MMLHRWFCLVVLLSALAFGTTSAQTFTAKLENIPGTNPPDAYDYPDMSAYHADFIYKQDIYVIYYQGRGPSIINGQWSWGFCGDQQSTECGDRVFMAWKHLSCLAGSPCGGDHYWNVYAGRSNYSTDPSENPGNGNMNFRSTGTIPPIQRMTGWVENQNLGYLPTGCPTSYNYYGGSGRPGVIYVNGKWYMAYDAAIARSDNPGNSDIHRIAWASSTDGANWTVHGIVFRDFSETFDCGAGAQVNNLYFENNTFYMYMMSLGTNRQYLLKSPYNSSTATGYHADGWWAPTGINGSGNLEFPNYPAIPNVPTGALVDPSSSNWQPINDVASYGSHGSLAKVHPTNTSPDYRYITVNNVDTAPFGPPTPAAQPLMRVCMSDGTFLERPFTNCRYIYPADNLTGKTAHGYYGWSPKIPWLVPDATYTRVYSPVTTFINYYNGFTNNSIARVRLKLSGDIYSAPPAPTGLTASAASTSSVNISWQASVGATSYELQRGTTLSNFITISSNATSPYTDTSVLPTTTYLYRVRALNDVGSSPFSNTDLTTTVLFSDDPLVAGVSAIRVAHLTELRQAVNAVRAAANLALGVYTDDPVTAGVTPFKPIHVSELRTQLNDGVVALGFASLSVTDPTLIPGLTALKRVHIQELRSATK